MHSKKRARMRRSKRRRTIVIFLIGLLSLLLTLLPSSVFAQDNSVLLRTEKANIVVDGNVLFSIGSFGNHGAAERAEKINEALKRAITKPENFEFLIDTPGKDTPEKDKNDEEITAQDLQTKPQNLQPNPQNLQTNISLGDLHLLTVTWEDVITAANTEDQAREWRPLIKAAIEDARYQRTSEYLNHAWVLAGSALLIAIGFFAAVFALKQWLTSQFERWFASPSSSLHPWEQPAKLFLNLAVLGLQIGLTIAIGYYVIDLFPQSRSWTYQLITSIVSPFIPLGDKTFSILEILLLLTFSIGLWFAIGTLTRLFRSYVLAQSGANYGMQEVLTIFFRYVLTFVGLIIILQAWGVDASSLTILGGALGVGIGFGVQNIANNFISGIIIIIERPIQIGDFVKVADLTGIVKRIGSRSTEIFTLDQISIIIPNSRFLESEVINWSHGNPTSRLRIPIGVAYGSDVELVKRALLEAAKGHPEVLLRPRPQVWFQEFGDSSLNFELLVWTGEPKKQPRIKSDLNYRIDASLRRYNIEIPFPQRDLHLRSPQIEQFMAVWLQQNAPPSFDKNLNPASSTSLEESKSNPVPVPVEQLMQPTWSSDSSDREILEMDIEDVVEEMRKPDGLEVKDRRYRLQTYSSCFVGTEAVDWMVTRYNCQRPDALTLGQMLVDRGIIHHVTDEHSFEDNYLFYRFYADEEKQ